MLNIPAQNIYNIQQGRGKEDTMIPFANPANFTRSPTAAYSLALRLPSSSSILLNRRRILFEPFHRSILLSANESSYLFPF
jgi:hypothetical protein